VIVRAVTGLCPAIVATVDDSARLEALCMQLARAERVAELLQAHDLDRLPIDEGVKLPLEGS